MGLQTYSIEMASEDASAKLLVGDIVVLHSLPGNQYNGKLAAITDIIQATGRYRVHVEGEKGISVLPKNLTKLEDVQKQAAQEEEEERKTPHEEAPQELCEENQNATEAPKFLVGDIVLIHSMENLPQYDGKLGAITEVTESTGRYRVYVDGEKEISVLQKNLIMLEDAQQQATQEEEESTLLHEEAPQELGEDKQKTAYARGDADTTKAKSLTSFQDFIALAPLELKMQLPENQTAELEESYNHLSPDSQDVLVNFLRREVNMKTKKGDAYDAEAGRRKMEKMFAFVAKRQADEKKCIIM
eukprot:gnl/MRDRNA2_/MRDRNA2_85450_c1_seq7.p1 gnl/MRDRNA2_/MRDRNA2_85450_c1~~gnl/MRDRNA2_/MRDRNA2_85450_c1_seq7.p1  ORF type:complete len:301 (-),score=71.95 gnl/MRDRNA2_/MRDRNA2_85450_c1_seq7:126-1028(-)